jgi:hypothetical protein
MATTVVVLTGEAAAQARAIPADAAGWSIVGNGVRVLSADGQPAFSMRSGRAIRRDVSLLDGTIDVDVRLTRARSFVYVQFRMQNDDDMEEFYLRPHKSDLPDATQYAPVFFGQSAWQLYHGPGATAAVPFTPGVWTRVRVVLSGRRAALFIGDTVKPALVVPRLAREPAAGYVGLRSFLPAGVEVAEDPAMFRNLVVRPGIVAYDFAGAPPAPVAAPGNIMRWEIAHAFAPDTAALVALPAAAQPLTWRAVDAEPNGMLMLTRHLAPPAGVRPWATYVRLRLRSDRAQTVPLDLGFSDQVTVFVNGTALYSADARYSYDDPRQEGVIGLHQSRAFLPLRRGANDVVLLVSDVFGGWAVMGRLSAPGVTIATP